MSVCEHGHVPEACARCSMVRAKLKGLAERLAERRERIATAVLQGMVAAVGANATPWRDYASDAVDAADALIAELDRRAS